MLRGSLKITLPLQAIKLAYSQLVDYSISPPAELDLGFELLEARRESNLCRHLFSPSPELPIRSTVYCFQLSPLDLGVGR